MERTIPKHTGVPTFFRGCCYEASQGGAKTYRNAAWHLAIHLNDQVPYDTELDDWQNHIEELRAACDEQDQEEIWHWFKRDYTKCMQLIPNRRKKPFVNGVLDAYAEGRI